MRGKQREDLIGSVCCSTFELSSNHKSFGKEKGVLN
jgi:hypothetical protein